MLNLPNGKNTAQDELLHGFGLVDGEGLAVAKSFQNYLIRSGRFSK